jgi:hypothetical protein
MSGTEKRAQPTPPGRLTRVEFRYGFVEPAGLDRGAVKVMGRSRTGLGRATGGGQRAAAMKGSVSNAAAP